MSVQVKVFYSATLNRFAEYYLDLTYKMYRYVIYDESGDIEHGLIGLERMTEVGKVDSWTYIGVL